MDEEFKTFEDLKEALGEIIPTASFQVADNGEIIIHTGLAEDDDGELIAVEETDEDFDFTADHDTEVPYEETDEDD